MQVQSVVNMFRALVNSVNGASARTTDATAILWCDRATKWAVSDLLFPSSRLTIVTIANQQAYSLPEVYQIDRVYMAGQPIVPTDIHTLEGNQIGLYDQFSQGAPVAGSDAPPGAGGSGQPAWTCQAPVAYPFVNNWGSPAPMAQPWFVGQRPRYYLRGGALGLVPAPGNAVDLVVDCVLIPTTVMNLTDTLVVPDNFTDAIAWKMAAYASFSDNQDRAADSRNFAAQMADKELRALRTWKRQYTGDNSPPKIQTYRSGFQIGGAQSGDYQGGGGGYGW